MAEIQPLPFEFKLKQKILKGKLITNPTTVQDKLHEEVKIKLNKQILNIPESKKKATKPKKETKPKTQKKPKGPPKAKPVPGRGRGRPRKNPLPEQPQIDSFLKKEGTQDEVEGGEGDKEKEEESNSEINKEANKAVQEPEPVVTTGRRKRAKVNYAVPDEFGNYAETSDTPKSTGKEDQEYDGSETQKEPESDFDLSEVDEAEAAQLDEMEPEPELESPSQSQTKKRRRIPTKQMMEELEKLESDGEDDDSPDTIELDVLESAKHARLGNNQASIINSGIHNCKVEWCPGQHSNQYLVLGGHLPTLAQPYLRLSQQSNYTNELQIWSISNKLDFNTLKLDAKLVFNHGCIWDIQWCPINFKTSEGNYDEKSVLGILAICCGDGIVRVYCLPHPDYLRKKFNLGEDEIVNFELEEPLQAFKLNKSFIHCLRWGGPSRLAVGSAEGYVTVWPFNLDNQTHIPVFSQLFHKGLVTALDWYLPKSVSYSTTYDPENEAESLKPDSYSIPKYLCSSGSDGRVQVYNTFEPYIPLKFSRTKAIVDTCSWLPYEYNIPCIIHPDGSDGLRLKLPQVGSNTLIAASHQSSIWKLGVSRDHSQVLSLSSDGRLKMLAFPLPVKFRSKAKTLIFPLFHLKLQKLEDDKEVLEIDNWLEKIPKLGPMQIKTQFKELVDRNNNNVAYPFNKHTSLFWAHWNENTSYTNLFATSTISGLIIVKKVSFINKLRILSEV